MKVSGEALSGEGAFGVQSEPLADLAQQVKRGLESGDVELAMVVGGGNFLRGRQLLEQGIDRPTGDSMGMLATIINAIALRSALEKVGVDARVLSAVPCGSIAERFVRGRCIKHLARGRVVVLAGGTGHPFFTTDTTAALRALEIGADVLLKGTKVRGVFSGDPNVDDDVEFFDKLTFLQVLKKELKVMDSAAISLCMDHQLPIVVFNAWEPGNVERALRGETLGTRVG